MGKSLTIEEFIKKAKKVHGDKYDYSKVDYQNVYKLIIIICPIHGEFEQVPHNHLKGNGCPKCANEKNPNIKLTTEEFIKRSNIVHNNKYNYSKTKYVDSKTNVLIICPKHGEFSQNPTTHYHNKSGCPKCKVDRTKEWYKEQRKKYLQYNEASQYCINNNIKSGKQYYKFYRENKPNFLPADPSKIYDKEWTNWQTFLNTNNVSARELNNFEYFLQKSNEVHGDKYDYSKVKYTNCNNKIIIICPEHGEFEQNPASHLQGRGCPKCAGKYMDKNFFIEKANKIHNNKYDYSKVEYVDGRTPVIIICPEHGEFKQTANSHVQGTGCPKCGNRYTPTLNEFITKAQQIHGDKYDYSKVEFKSIKKTKIVIICPVHGEFQQTASSHLKGNGCPYCSNVKIFNPMPFHKLKELVRKLNIKTQKEYWMWWKNNRDFCIKNGIPHNPHDHYS